jgi:hypothetical protein
VVRAGHVFLMIAILAAALAVPSGASAQICDPLLGVPGYIPDGMIGGEIELYPDGSLANDSYPSEILVPPLAGTCPLDSDGVAEPCSVGHIPTEVDQILVGPQPVVC